MKTLEQMLERNFVVVEHLGFAYKLYNNFLVIYDQFDNGKFERIRKPARITYQRKFTKEIEDES